MRERLTAAFVLVTLLVVFGGAFARSYAVTGAIRERESDLVTSQARSIGQVIAREIAAGDTVDEVGLRDFVVPGMQLVYERRDEPTIVLAGRDFDSATDADGVSATVFTGDGALTVTRASSKPLNTFWGSDLGSMLGLLSLLVIVAGTIGYLVARGLSRPFRQLAVAAGALGRGRFDLELPATRIPEARKIARALESSAAQLRDRLEREREFGLLASHVLRTPLTSLRLNLEELVGDPDLTEDTREMALRCLTTVGRIGEVAGELVEVSGRGVLVEGAAVPLHDLAKQVAQRWADTLEDSHRVLTAAVEGDIDLLFTPGPVEQVLDLVLLDVMRRQRGAVRLVFEGSPSFMTVDISCDDGTGRMAAPSEPDKEHTGAVLTALGARIEMPSDGSVLRVFLPRR